jgi:hypothetical protein
MRIAPKNSSTAIAKFAASKGFNLATSTPRIGLPLMFDLYTNSSASKCAGPDCDMLLYQWGTYDWGEGRHFDLEIVRQFNEQRNPDDQGKMSQLHLAYRYEPTSALEAIIEGNFWCHEKGELAIFSANCLSSPAFAAVADLHAKSVIIRHEYV